MPDEARRGTGEKAKKAKRAKKALDPIALERAAVEEAERRHREEAILVARLEQMREEEAALTKRSMTNVEARWIVFLRECKRRELVAEIEVVRRTFEAAIDRKDAVIDILSTDLNEAEDQQRLVFYAHTSTVDKLVQLHSRRMTDLEKEFERDLFEMKGDYEREMAELVRKHNYEVDDLKLILDNMAIEAERLEKRLQEDISEAHETALEKMEEERKQLQNELIRTSETIRAELNTRYKDFMATAQVNMKDYMDKSKEDAETTERIAAQVKRIEKLQENVTSWRTNIARNAKEWEQKNSAIQQERDATIRHLKTLKNKMQNWRKKESSRLAELIKNATNAENNLRSVSLNAERILRLVELSKPLETERERVLSFESNISTGEIERDVKRLVANDAAEAAELQLQPTDESSAPDGAAFSEDWRLLERFWTKHNKVVLDNVALAQERHHLEEENKKLQMLLRQYLDDITVNNDVMQKPNTLLLTKKAPNVVEAAQKSGRKVGQKEKPVVVEGNKVVRDVTMQVAIR